MFMRLIVFAVLLLVTFQVDAQGPTEVCPVEARVRREAQFQPGGLILTAFDRSGLWVVDIDGRVRYPLDNTRLCGTNCRLSPDATSVTYLDGEEETYRRMTLDGIYRETLYEDTANDVLYWSPDTLLVYTAGKRAYLQNANGSRVEIDMSSILSIQPGGLWALALDYRDGVFVRQLLNDSGDAAIVRATIDLGRSLGLSIIAKGIEDIETANCLKHMGCDEGQGYHFGRPLPAAEFEQLLLARHVA